MKKLLVIIVLGLLINTSLNAKQLSKSPFIPDNIQDEFNKLSTEHKINFCGFENYKPRKSIINKDLAIRILGYNSRNSKRWKIC